MSQRPHTDRHTDTHTQFAHTQTHTQRAATGGRRPPITVRGAMNSGRRGGGGGLHRRPGGGAEGSGAEEDEMGEEMRIEDTTADERAGSDGSEQWEAVELRGRGRMSA